MAFDSGLSWAFAAIGVATQGVAILLLRRPVRLLFAGGSARGTVVESDDSLVQGSHGSAQTYSFPIVQFTTRQGERISFRSRVGVRTARAKGSDVRVIFDPEKPHDAELATFKALWLFPTITAAFGLPFLLAGLRGLL